MPEINSQVADNRLLETVPEVEQARCPRAGLVTSHSGGSGVPLVRH